MGWRGGVGVGERAMLFQMLLLFVKCVFYLFDILLAALLGLAACGELRSVKVPLLAGTLPMEISLLAKIGCIKILFIKMI